MRSEAQRRADAAYQKRNAEKIAEKFAFVSCKISRDLADAFSEKCAERGVSKNAVIRSAIEKFLEE